MTTMSCTQQNFPPQTGPTVPAAQFGGSPRPRPDVAELIVRTADGDPAAFTGLCAQLWPEVFGFAHRLLLDAHQAEEVTQETFLQIWQQADRFDPVAGSAQGWIFTLARGRAIAPDPFGAGHPAARCPVRRRRSSNSRS
ncbi:hypothetical protein ABIB25_005398 [Nakamurella sp. UYEF19]|uniref:sigma factor n=1 Tax=Nakamurella sp. UYEF19 TaxID=1756392 RepID=UPI0033912068